MNVQYNISVKDLNTFGIEAHAKEFVEVHTIEELLVIVTNFNLHERKVLILGGGSNVLFTKDYEGMIIRNSIKGIRILEQNETYILVKAMGGEIWHEFVMFCVEKGYGGVENLSLIPGCVGAAPMQNIGAYGVEIKDVVESLEAVEIETGEIVNFKNADCHFGYRESIFKHEAKNKYIIVSCTFRLSKNPVFNITYGAIQQVLDKKGVKKLSVKAISDAVIEIRKSKLPNPKELGNAGSFFKNPEINSSLFQSLKTQFPEMTGYPAPENKIKLAAGWLIEQCGWKGKVIGKVGAHKNQALVLVNYGGATGGEILALATDIQKSVYEKFGIDILPEVNII